MVKTGPSEPLGADATWGFEGALALASTADAGVAETADLPFLREEPSLRVNVLRWDVCSRRLLGLRSLSVAPDDALEWDVDWRPCAVFEPEAGMTP